MGDQQAEAKGKANRTLLRLSGIICGLACWVWIDGWISWIIVTIVLGFFLAMGLMEIENRTKIANISKNIAIGILCMVVVVIIYSVISSTKERNASAAGSGWVEEMLRPRTRDELHDMEVRKKARQQIDRIFNQPPPKIYEYEIRIEKGD